MLVVGFRKMLFLVSPIFISRTEFVNQDNLRLGSEKKMVVVSDKIEENKLELGWGQP